MNKIVVKIPEESEIVVKISEESEIIMKIQEIVMETLSKMLANQPETSYLTRKEVADLLKVSTVSIDRWVKQGLLTAHKVGSRVLFIPEQVDMALKIIPTLKKYRRTVV